MQLEIIKPHSLIDIQISPAFLTRLHELLTWIITSQEPELVRKANEKISQGQELDEWDEHYATLLTLIHSIEETARTQNKTEMIPLNESPS
jgi:hypothetical protein